MSVGYDVRINQSAWQQALQIYTDIKKKLEQEKANQISATNLITHDWEGAGAFSLRKHMFRNLEEGRYRDAYVRVGKMKTILEENCDQINFLLTCCEGFLDQLQENIYVSPDIVVHSNEIENADRVLCANYAKLRQIKSICDEISDEACILKDSLNGIMSDCGSLVDGVGTYYNEIENAYMKLNRVINYRIAVDMFMSNFQALEEDINIALKALFLSVDQTKAVGDKKEDGYIDDKILYDMFRKDERFKGWREEDINTLIEYLRIAKPGLLSSMYATSRYSTSDYEKLKESILSMCYDNKEVIMSEMILYSAISEDSRFDNWSAADIIYMVEYLKTIEGDAINALYGDKQNNSSDFRDVLEMLLATCDEEGELLLGENLLRETIENDARFADWTKIDIDNYINYLKETRSYLLVELFNASISGSSSYEDLQEMILTHDYKQEDINAALQELINIAYKKKGTGEAGGNDNNTEFNTWYYGHQVSGSDYAWCSVFVLWCMNQAGMLDGKHILPEYQECYDNCMSGVRNLAAYYSLNQKYHCIKGEDDETVVKNSGAYPKAYTQIIYDNYTPHNGDFIVFDNGESDHIGIVVGYDAENQIVYTVEGNSGNEVKVWAYYLYDEDIQGFCDNGGTETDIYEEIDTNEIKPTEVIESTR